jgi:hypothetical protein
MAWRSHAHQDCIVVRSIPTFSHFFLGTMPGSSA